MVKDLAAFRSVLALAVVLAFAGACPAPAAAPEPAGPGQDLTGASCREKPREDIARDPIAPPPVYLYCGAKDRPSGAVAAIVPPLSMPSEEGPRHAAIEEAAQASPAGRDAATRMTCRTGTWLREGGDVDLLVKPCSLNEGNWPQVVAIASLGKYVIQGEGIPALLPVLEGAMARLADYRPAEGTAAFGGAEAAAKALKAVFGDAAVLAGSGELERYDQLSENARMYNSRKNFRAAEDDYREALNIQTRALGPSATGVGLTLMSLALEVSNQGRFEEAAGLLRRADPIVQSSTNAADRARFFTYLAFDAANQAKFVEALRYAGEATAVWRELIRSGPAPLSEPGGGDGQAANRGELAHGLNIEAAMALRVGDVAHAEAAAREALGIVGEVSGLPPWWRPEILETMGEINARQGRLGEAEASFRGALIFKQRLFGETAPTAVTLLALGRVYADEKLYMEAVRSYEFALRILETDDVARTGLVFDQIAPFLVAAAAVAERDASKRAELDAEMFRAVQLVTADVIDQTISRASVRLAAGDPAIEALVRDLQETERARDTARIELAHETSLPDEQRGALKEAALLAEINKGTAKLEALDRQIEKAFPAYAKLAHPGAIELKDVQRQLRPREALVLFEIGRERAAALVVRPDRFLARPLELDGPTLATAVGDLRKAFVVHGGAVEDFDLSDANALYRALFGPIAAALADVDHLIVVPSAALASLPVGLLVTEKPAAGASSNYRGAAWLVRRYATSQAPSVRAFTTLRARGEVKPARLPLLAIGNPAFEGVVEKAAKAGAKPSGLELLARQCRDAGPIPPAFLKALAPLPDTAAEVEAVAKILGSGKDALMLGAGATEAALRARTLDDYRVLYFATHGLLPGELSCQSEPALALSPPAAPAGSKAEDGLLDASEIAGLKLNAELVVLSACNTASGGGRFGGEALSGLAESFFFAGARTLIASHWQVPSAATMHLMIGLFERLGPELGGGIAESLRRSQLALIERADTAHPFFWAAFTVIGDGARPQAAGSIAEVPPAGGSKP